MSKNKQSGLREILGRVWQPIAALLLAFGGAYFTQAIDLPTWTVVLPIIGGLAWGAAVIKKDRD